MTVAPPRLARWLVERALPDDVREDVSGDLSELFHRDLASEGRTRASARYWRNAISCSIRFRAERCLEAPRGGLVHTAQSRRDARRAPRMFMGWRLDLALAARMLIRHPALSAIGIFGIAVAIAIAGTMFTVIGEQLGPSALPLPQGDRIVAFQKWDRVNNQSKPLAPDDLVAWREQLSTVRDIGAFRTVTKNLILPPVVPEPIAIAEMSAAGFDVAGVRPLKGRVFGPADERADAAPVVVIGYAEWRRRFGADADLLNRTVQLGDTHHTVVGIMPEGFAFPINHAYWIPLRLRSSPVPLGGGAPLSLFGRLAQDATLQSAQAELTAVAERARAASPNTRLDVLPRVVSYAYQFAEMDQPANRLALQLVRFFIAVLLVVVCINIAVLVYARTAAREAEIAVRTALGASRSRIVAQLFVEGLVLAGLGALAGVALATVALVHVREGLAQGEPLPFWIRFTVSGQTMTYIAALTVAAAAVIGALPAWKATAPQMQSRLQALTAGGGGGMHLGRVWTALIVLQVAFAVALLPVVVVRMSELAREGLSQFGYAAHEFVVAQLSMEPPAAAPSGSADAASLFARRFHDLEQQIARDATVGAVAFSSFAPGFEPSALVLSDLGTVQANVGVNRVSVNFFDTYRVPLLTGRNFTSADAAVDGRAVIVNRAFAQRVSSGGAVLASRIRPVAPTEGVRAFTGFADDWYQIVGVVQDFPPPASGAEAEPRVYKAITPDATLPLTVTLHLPAADTGRWGGRLQQIAANVDPLLQVTNVTPIDGLLRQEQRTMRLLAGVFAAMTLSVLLLSAAGIYAMMAFSVAQRRREIGIRLALGAGARTILWTMFSRSAGQLLVGAGIGTVVAVLLTRAAYGAPMSGQARMATAAVVMLVTIAGLLAGVGPARQGLRIEPTEALRDRAS